MATTFDPRQPFSRAEGRAGGVTTGGLLTGRFRRIGYDIYVAREVAPTVLVHARAVIRLAPAGSRISHQTAAELWGGTIPPDAQTHVTMPSANGRLVRRGVRSHYGGGRESVMRQGVPVSSPVQVFLELAASGLGLVDLVVLADSLIRRGVTTSAALVEAAEGTSRRGCRTARRAAQLSRAGVDSPMETRLRLLIVLAGLPEPRVNLVLRGADGTWRRRYDLAYEGLRLIVEYDGRQHATDAEQWRTDIFRREELDQMRWRMVVVTAEGIFADPLQTLERVRGAMVECGATGLRRTFTPEWRLHFGS